MKTLNAAQRFKVSFFDDGRRNFLPSCKVVFTNCCTSCKASEGSGDFQRHPVLGIQSTPLEIAHTCWFPRAGKWPNFYTKSRITGVVTEGIQWMSKLTPPLDNPRLWRPSHCRNMESSPISGQWCLWRTYKRMKAG